MYHLDLSIINEPVHRQHLKKGDARTTIESVQKLREVQSRSTGTRIAEIVEEVCLRTIRK